jgi:hypothetical protein
MSALGFARMSTGTIIIAGHDEDKTQGWLWWYTADLARLAAQNVEHVATR